MRTGAEVVEALPHVHRSAAGTAPVQAGPEYAARFHSRVRSAMRRFVASSPRAADLAYVFPGAAYVIAAKAGPASDLEKARRLTLEGAPLRDVARTLGLPLWLRRLPPEAFHTAPGALPSSEMFTRRIANHLPIPAGESALWLACVAFAARACDEYFALWLAGQRIFMEPHRDPEKLLAVLAAYAWFSGADRTRGHNLIVTPWRPEMAFDTAVCAAKSWLNRVRLVVQLREGVVGDAWLSPGEVNGLTFAPLLSANEILAESRAMQNCADQYSDRLARDRCRLFSVRRRGVRVATLEIGPHAREPNMLAINQLKARHNLPAASEIWQAAHAWLAIQPELRRTPEETLPERPLNPAVWGTLMQPYRTAKDGARWLPAKPTAEAFGMLDGHVTDLARRGGVSSWLFTA
jgi:hypothetical protein